MGEIRKKLDKKRQKKRAATDLDEIDASLQKFYDEMPKPTWRSTLPYRTSVASFKFACSLPFLIKDGLQVLFAMLKGGASKSAASSANENETHDGEDNTDDDVDSDDSADKRKHLSLNPTRIEKSSIKAPVVAYESSQRNGDASQQQQQTKPSSKEWSAKEKADLIKAIQRYPPGTVNRWARVSEQIGRTANDCIQMEKTLKSNLSTLAPKTDTVVADGSWMIKANRGGASINSVPTEASNDAEAAGEENNNNASTNGSSEWSQEQQALFEKALKTYDKSVANRWEKIAECVPNKNKDDCVERFKTLCMALKKKQ